MFNRTSLIIVVSLTAILWALLVTLSIELDHIEKSLDSASQSISSISPAVDQLGHNPLRERDVQGNVPESSKLYDACIKAGGDPYNDKDSGLFVLCNMGHSNGSFYGSTTSDQGSW